MRGTYVYLAGPITGLTFDGAQDWRDKAKALFDRVGVSTRSPLRGKRFLRSRGVLESGYFDIHPLSSPKGIVARDRNDVIGAGVMLANLAGSDRISIGTVLELAWADMARVPVVVVMEPEGNVHDHAMVRELASYVTPSLEDAWAIACTVLGYDVAVTPHQPPTSGGPRLEEEEPDPDEGPREWEEVIG